MYKLLGKIGTNAQRRIFISAWSDHQPQEHQLFSLNLTHETKI